MAVLKRERDNRKLTVKLYKHHDQEKRFAERFKNKSNVNFAFADTYPEVFNGADIIISAVIKATKNFAQDECFKEGVTVIPICTMGFQNCDLFFDKVFTDEIEQIRGFKYFNQFIHGINNIIDIHVIIQ